MAIQPNVESLQHIEVGVSGPDGANRMFITTGLARTGLYVYSNESTKENYSLHVEPPLTASQFRRAIATAAVGEARFNDYDAGQQDGMHWRVDEVDADFDDEEGKVQLRFTLLVRVTGTGTASLDTIPFTVTTLAKV